MRRTGPLLLGLALLGAVVAGCSGSADEMDNSPAPKGTVPSTPGVPPPHGGTSAAPGAATDGDGK